MRHRAALLVATLALSSRARSQVSPTALAPDSVERLLASIRAGYDSGFSQLIAALPATARDRSTKLWLLWQLGQFRDRKSTRLNSSHLVISYAVFCLKKKKSKRTCRPQ